MVYPATAQKENTPKNSNGNEKLRWKCEKNHFQQEEADKDELAVPPIYVSAMGGGARVAEWAEITDNPHRHASLINILLAVGGIQKWCNKFS